MGVQVETLEKSMAKLTIEIPAEELEKALQETYLKQKSKIGLPGFRKGKVPRNMIEKMYGPEIFYEDAANLLIQENYGTAADESGLDIVSRATIDITQIEKGKPFIFTAEVAVKPEVSLGEYKGIAVTAQSAEVTEEEIDKEIERERENNARTLTVEDRAIEEGDTVVIDFEGFVDGIPFEGGKGENQTLEIGSHSFIDTFEEQLIGKNSGDEAEVNVTFPEEYHAEDLAGKPAVFKVKIHEIRTKELPDLDDEFAQDVSEFDTLDAYKEDVRQKLVKAKEADIRRAQEDEAIRQIVENASMELPQPMIDLQVESMIDDFAQRIAQQGMDFNQYMQFSGMTVDKMKEQLEPEAVARIKSSLVLEQIAKEEKIEVTEEDIDAEIGKLSEAYGMEKEKVQEILGDSEKDSMKRDLAVQKAVSLVMDYVVEHAKEESEEE